MSENEELSPVERARALNERRLAAMQPLIDANEELARARTSLVEAERHRDTQLVAALKAGWNEAELREIGLTDQPPKPRRKRAPRAVSAKMPTTPMSTDSDDSNLGHEPAANEPGA